MGVVLNDKPVNVKTSELNDWICKVRVKKLSCKRQKRKNLFIEAVLSNALVKAETLLRTKQQERRMRWEKIKSHMPDATSHNRSSVWDTRTCEDLHSIDNFMLQLNSVKVPVQR